MLEQITGNILEIQKGIICQQVNCMGVMGKGLALQIKQKYPVVEKQYKTLCSIDRPLGYCQLILVKPDLWVANLFGQYDYAKSSQDKHVYTNYDSLQQCLRQLVEYNDSSEPVYIPHKLGCGLANGDWSVVSKIIEEIIPDAIIVKLGE